MIDGLKRRFIVAATLSVAAVILVIAATVNILNYTQIAGYADKILLTLDENGGSFPPNGYSSNDDASGGEEYVFGPETPHETRFFLVKFVGDQAVADVRNIISVSGQKAVELARTVWPGKKVSGYINEFRFLKSYANNSVLFVDCSRQFKFARQVLLKSLVMSLVGILSVFIVAVCVSGKVVAPFAESYERQKRFITDAGHELKTPLSVISANNELIELTSGKSEYTEAISGQVVNMAAMVRNMTELARMHEEKTDFSDFDFSVALSETVDGMSSVLKAGGRELTTEIGDFRYFGNERLFRRAFGLLLDNAAKYALTFVDVKLFKEGRQLVLAISNDAENVVRKDYSECFERFYRGADARASRPDGSGIGLSVVKEIVSIHKGSVSASGDRNGVFTVKIKL